LPYKNEDQSTDIETVVLAKSGPDLRAKYEKVGGKLILVQNDFSSKEQLRRLKEAYLKQKQVAEYDATKGPNSNTWAWRLLVTAGFSSIPTPPDTPGWNYTGEFGYGGKYFNEDGTWKPAWKEYVTKWYQDTIIQNLQMGGN
jgi:hypothetical protein